jgi:hypothetical protein
MEAVEGNDLPPGVPVGQRYSEIGADEPGAAGDEDHPDDSYQSRVG